MDNQGFKVWMDKVNDAVEAKVGLTAYDLPDLDYWNMFNDGVSAKSAANKAIKNARD